jgi:hypothetical protein
MMLGVSRPDASEIAAKLSLTADQEPLVLEILEDAGGQWAEMMKGFEPGGGDRTAAAEMRQTMRDLEERTEMELGQILTPGQMEIYRNYMESLREEQRANTGAVGRGPAGAAGWRP